MQQSRPEPTLSQGALRRQQARPRTIDDEFAELAAQAPGFGGLAFDRTGGVSVYLTDVNRAPEAAPAILAFLQRYGKIVSPSALTIQQGRFDFAQLADAYVRVKQVLPTEGITQTDIDDRRNLISIGVLDDAAAAAARSAVTPLRLPDGMLVIERIAPTVGTETLRERVRPPIGGIEIGLAGNRCTLGYTVLVWDVQMQEHLPGWYFLTNAHCTSEWGSLNYSREVFQPYGAEKIGWESVDPRFFTNTEYFRCRQGRACRYSDAALIQYVSPNYGTLGRIAKTNACYGCIDIVGQYWITLEDIPWSGQTAIEGAWGGFSSGEYLKTCVDVSFYWLINDVPHDSGKDFLCQWQGDYRPIPGDSGAGVFAVTSGDNVTIYGVNWGTAYELGYPGQVFATWSSHFYAEREISNTIEGYPPYRGDPCCRYLLHAW
jgi:hypothetical protein